MTVSFMSNIISDKHTRDAMGKVCGIQGNDDKCTQVYGGKSFRKESPWMSHVNGMVILQQILKDKESKGVNWIHLDQDTNQWHVVVTTLTTFRFHK
jgi:hypothetical protein